MILHTPNKRAAVEEPPAPDTSCTQNIFGVRHCRAVGDWKDGESDGEDLNRDAANAALRSERNLTGLCQLVAVFGARHSTRLPSTPFPRTDEPARSQTSWRPWLAWQSSSASHVDRVHPTGADPDDQPDLTGAVMGAKVGSILLTHSVGKRVVVVCRHLPSPR